MSPAKGRCHSNTATTRLLSVHGLVRAPNQGFVAFEIPAANLFACKLATAHRVSFATCRSHSVEASRNALSMNIVCAPTTTGVYSCVLRGGSCVHIWQVYFSSEFVSQVRHFPNLLPIIGRGHMSAHTSAAFGATSMFGTQTAASFRGHSVTLHPVLSVEAPPDITCRAEVS